MRTNLPVSQQGYTLPPDQALVSVTDTKGRITYCNPAFVEVSSYTTAELMGQPHNLVRHPDMPEEAFRDMRDTIQARQPWTGVVKNHRKNGDYYGLRANATPMVDGQQITGYLSVRTAPSQESIAAAETLDAQMRAQARAGTRSLGLFRGQVVRTDLVGRVRKLSKPGLLAKLCLVQLALTAIVVAALVIDAPLALVIGLACVAGLTVWTTPVMTISPLAALVIDANHLAAAGVDAEVGESAHCGE